MKFWLFAIGLLLTVGVTGLRLTDPQPVRELRDSYFDYLQRAFPRAAGDYPVIVVDIDEQSLREQGQWPWPRTRLALLTTRLTELGAASIAYDMIFAEKDRYSLSSLADELRQVSPVVAENISSVADEADNDAIFANAIDQSRVILGTAALPRSEAIGFETAKVGFVELGEAPGNGLVGVGGTVIVLPRLSGSAAGVGLINVSPDSFGGVVRRVPLVWRTDEGLLPSISIEALRIAMGTDTLIVRGSNNLAGVVNAVQIGPLLAETTDRGELWLRYREEDHTDYLSAASLMSDEFPAELAEKVAGKIVLIGTSAAGLLDLRATSLGQVVPGVAIHAQLIEQIIAQDFLKRDSFIEGIEVLGLVAIGLIMSALIAFSTPVISLVAGALTLAGYVGVSVGYFVQSNTMLDATMPAIAGFLVFVLLLAIRFLFADRERREMRRSFSQYLAPSVLDQIEQSRYHTALGGEVRDLTIMFLDLHNFTTISEQMEPQDLVKLLNDLFTELAESILEREGTIDKYIGDSIMAFWNAPLDIEDHTAKAAAAALNIQERLRQFVARRGETAQSLRVGVGLAAGEACVGNMGSRQRFDYSAIGDSVNVAARLESQTRTVGWPILANAECAKLAPDLAWLDAGALALKGKQEREPVWILVGDEQVARSEAFAALAAAHAELLDCVARKDACDRAVETCQEAATRISADLNTFYARVVTRPEDFAMAAAAQLEEA